MRAVMSPSSPFFKSNSFSYLLVNSLHCCDATASSPSRALSKGDLLHVHWSHNYVRLGRWFGGIIATAQFLGLCFYHRLRGARIVWTVHDLRSLTSRNESLEKFLMAIFTRMAGGLIFLNRSSQAELY